MRPPYRTALFASLLALICAGVLWAAYDWFQGRYLRAFSEHTAVFSGDPLRLPDNLAGPGNTFPWGTLSINILGSLAMGALVGWLARGTMNPQSAEPLRLR